MPRTKFQTLVFTALTIFVMAYSITFYNLALGAGRLCGTMLLGALGGMRLPYGFAVGYELLIARPVAFRLALRVVRPDAQPLVRIVALAVAMVSLMCSVMSLFVAATIYGVGGELPQRWGALFLRTYPFALGWQLFVAGPLVRALFGRLFRAAKMQ